MGVWRLLPRMAAAALVLRLEFDGAFRPPKDFGFPTIAAKLATCSASLSLAQLNENNDTIIPCAMGCQWLEGQLDMTSAHAEYGGLLLGVEYLWDHVENIEKFPAYSPHETILEIRGDCKAVIDQINGKSAPRRMQNYHKKVTDILSLIESKFERVDIKHVPRESNVLCDSLCDYLIKLIELQDLEACREGVTKSLMNKFETSLSSTSDLYDRHLRDETRCRISYSKRSTLYQAIAEICHESNDYDKLIEIGNRQATEASITKDNVMMAHGIRNQIHGWSGIGDLRKSDFLARKHRYLLLSVDDDEEIGLLHALTTGMTADHLWVNSLVTKTTTHHRDILQKLDDLARSNQWQEGSMIWVPPRLQQLKTVVAN